MLIGEMAARTGVSTKTLRFYEQAGLLHEPARTAGGYRDYDPAAHDRVVFIRQAQQAGLTLRQINEILAIRDDGRPPCDHVIRLVDHQLAEIEQRLDELRRTRSDLRALHDRLADLDTSACADHHVCTAIDGQS